MTDFTITQVDFDRLLDQNDEEQGGTSVLF